MLIGHQSEAFHIVAQQIPVTDINVVISRAVECSRMRTGPSQLLCATRDQSKRRQGWRLPQLPPQSPSPSSPSPDFQPLSFPRPKRTCGCDGRKVFFVFFFSITCYLLYIYTHFILSNI